MCGSFYFGAIICNAFIRTARRHPSSLLERFHTLAPLTSLFYVICVKSRITILFVVVSEPTTRCASAMSPWAMRGHDHTRPLSGSTTCRCRLCLSSSPRSSPGFVTRTDCTTAQRRGFLNVPGDDSWRSKATSQWSIAHATEAQPGAARSARPRRLASVFPTIAVIERLEFLQSFRASEF